MGNQQSRWKGRGRTSLWQSSSYVPLGSSPPSSHTQPLLDEDNHFDTSYPQLACGMCTGNYGADVEAICKRNLDTEKKVDELMKKVDKLQSRTSRNSRPSRNSAVIDYGDDIKKINERNASLENEIKKLKEKVSALELACSCIRGQETALVTIGERNTSENEVCQLVPDLISFEPIISDAPPSEIEHQRLNLFEENLAAGLMIVIFLLSVIIGMLL